MARPAFAASLVVIAGVMANGLVTEEPKGLRGEVTLEKSQGANGEEARATVRLDPPDAADDSYWLTAISWQAEEPLVNDPLEEVSPGVYRSTEPLPIDGNAKVLIRLHKDRSLLGLPVRANEDTAIPSPAIEAPAELLAAVRRREGLPSARAQGRRAGMAVARGFAAGARALAGLRPEPRLGPRAGFARRGEKRPRPAARARRARGHPGYDPGLSDRLRPAPT